MLRWNDWLGQAREEFSAADWLLQGSRYAWCCFTSQQAAEKALKAVLDYHNVSHMGHNLLDLVGLVAAHAHIPSPLQDACRRLNRHYIPTRYPDAYPSGIPADQYGRSDAEQALEDARAVMEFAGSHLQPPP